MPDGGSGSEIARASPVVGQRTADAVDHVAHLLRTEDAGADGYARLSLLVGAITVARLARDEDQARLIIDAARTAIDQIAPNP